MKGIIFNLLERVVVDAAGEDAWDRVLDAAGVEGSYTAVGTYPHDELVRLVKAVADTVPSHDDDIVQWFGRKALPLLAERYPVFFEGHASTRPFLLTLNDVIHPEVRKLFPGSYAPEFDFDDSDPNVLLLGYSSHRSLCSFGHGLIEGAAQHFGERAQVEQVECTKRGDAKCVFACTFTPA